MNFNLEDIPLRYLAKELVKKGMIAVVIAFIIPAQLITAEPSANLVSTLATEPEVEIFEGEKISVEISAYNAVPEQTDDTPCIVASGKNICEGNHGNIAASNFLPFGTRIMVPELTGDKVYVIEDRMNTRYQNNIDLLVDSRNEALTIGRSTFEVLVLND